MAARRQSLGLLDIIKVLREMETDGGAGRRKSQTAIETLELVEKTEGEQHVA